MSAAPPQYIHTRHVTQFCQVTECCALYLCLNSLSCYSPMPSSFPRNFNHCTVFLPPHLLFRTILLRCCVVVLFLIRCSFYLGAEIHTWYTDARHVTQLLFFSFPPNFFVLPCPAWSYPVSFLRNEIYLSDLLLLCMYNSVALLLLLSFLIL